MKTRTRSYRRASRFLVGCLTLAPIGRAEDWPHRRGPNRNDVVAEASLWKEGAWPLRERWARDVGEGASSPIVVAGRLYAFGWSDDQDRVVCLDTVSGEERWKRSYSAPRYGRLAEGDQGFFSGPSSTPEFDTSTGLLYTLGADGDLNC